MEELITAFMRQSLPCNPVPFTNALSEGVKLNGTPWIASNEAKAILHLINQMAYGQDYNINSVDEFDRLAGIFKKKTLL